MQKLSYDLFYGSPRYEWRLDRLFYEAYPKERQQGREPLQYMIAIAVKVGQYLTDKDFQGNAYPIKTPERVKEDLAKAVFAVLTSDRSWEIAMESNEWLSDRVQELVRFWIFQKLLIPELQLHWISTKL